MVFNARRDTILWVAANGLGQNDKQYTLNVKPAPRDFKESQPLGSKLRVGNHDYWAFDANVGDVMTFQFGANDFAQNIEIYDPTVARIWAGVSLPDQINLDGDIVVERPGRYLAVVASLGDGGGGDYTLSRKVYHAKEFSKGSPAQGSFEGGAIEVWKFTVKPGDPLYMHWKSSDWSYRISIRYANGAPAGLPLTDVDASNRYGILTASEPTTYLLILYPGEKKASYSIELSSLPGYKG
jgi:hypothetical protein